MTRREEADTSSRTPTHSRIVRGLVCAVLWIAPNASAQTNEIINHTSLTGVRSVVEDPAGNVYVAGWSSNNVFRIAPDGTIALVPSGGLPTPRVVAADPVGNVYVASDSSHDVVKLAPDGTVTPVMNMTGNGSASLQSPRSAALDTAGNLFVAGYISDNVFQVTPGGVITEILDSTGGGVAPLDGPLDVATDLAGNVYVACDASRNALRITPAGVVTQILGPVGVGGMNLSLANGIGVDDAGNVFVAGNSSSPPPLPDVGVVFKIAVGGAQSVVLTSALAGMTFDPPPLGGFSVDGPGNAYVTNGFNQNAFRVQPSGTITQIITMVGDGTNPLDYAHAAEAAPSGNVYVTGGLFAGTRQNAFRISPSDLGFPFCAGVGCPCGNDGAPGGCRNSTGGSALLTASGTTSVAADDLVLSTTGCPPNNTGLYFIGAATSAPILVGDGLACTGGVFRYFPGLVDGGGVFVQTNPVANAFPGAIVPGSTRYFQSWTRDVLCGPPPSPCASPCGANSNLSNGYAVQFTP